MSYDLISIGSVTKDIFVLTDRGKIFKTPSDKLAPVWLGFELGEKISVRDIIKTDGGVATNLSIGTKKLGLNSFPIGPKKPAVSVIIIDKKTGERVIFSEKSSGSFSLSDLKKKKARWLSVSSLKGNWSKEAREILSFIKNGETKLILSPSTSMLREGYSNFKKLIYHAEIIFINRNEAIEVAFKEKKNKTEMKNLISTLHNLGVKIVCITDGTKGAWVSDGQKIHHSPIKKVKTTDVTGAGDAFAAGFLGFFIKGKSIKESLRAGIVNSASVVRFIGTTKGLLNKNQI